MHLLLRNQPGQLFVGLTLLLFEALVCCVSYLISLDI